tara:strand:+ start:906 stop:1403 length:498 start_codon:yes stop_codon:yes gene_type:complete
MTYKPISGYENLYWINQNGMIINKKYKIIKLYQNNMGYLMINLYKKGIAKSFLLHRLLAHHYLECPDKSLKFIDHINGNILDNRLINLRYINSSGNSRNKRLKNPTKTGFTGVYISGKKKFISMIRDESGNKKYLGTFNTAEEASDKYQTEYNKLMNKFEFTRII